MRHAFSWGVILMLVIGVPLWAMAQQSEQMHGGGGVMSQGMMGEKTYASSGAGGPTANYSNLCASCHGATGQGNGPAAVALNPKPADFCTPTKYPTDADKIKIITEGGASMGDSPNMPAWGAALDQQAILDLVAYIHTLCKK